MKERSLLKARMPLAEVMVDFYDNVKSISSGYASVEFEPSGEDEVDLAKLDTKLNGEPVDALSALCPHEEAVTTGRKLVQTLQKNIDRQNFEIRIQACLGGKVIASSKVVAFRKDVLTKSGKTVISIFSTYP